MKKAGAEPESELPELSPAEEERLALALRHAFAPSDLDSERHERILRAVLEDPFAPASAAELVESERLRRAFEGEDAGEHADLALARALALAHSPVNVRAQALQQATRSAERPRSARVLYLRIASVTAGFAAAAALLLAVGQRPARAPAPDLQALTLAQSRSTAVLFPSAAAAGAPSTRIDRIASVRERELRENRYALWGVR